MKLQDPFPDGWEPFFINCNDSSVEGIKSTPDSGKRVWGVQFHPESILSQHGAALVENFLAGDREALR